MPCWGPGICTTNPLSPVNACVNVFFRASVLFNSIMIKPPCVVLVKEGNFPLFLAVEAIITSQDLQLPYICGQHLQSKYFDMHYQAYVMEKTPTHSFVTNLHYCHPYPLYLRKSAIGDILIPKNNILIS